MMEFREDSFEEWIRSIEERKQARRLIILPWAIWAAIIGITLAAALYPAMGHAAEVFRSQDDKGGAANLTLHAEPCGDAKVMAHLVQKGIPAEWIGKFQRATLFYWGRNWASCWVEYNGTVISFDEEGAPFQPIPRRLFRDESI